jgi:hypothetical protein
VAWSWPELLATAGQPDGRRHLDQRPGGSDPKRRRSCEPTPWSVHTIEEPQPSERRLHHIRYRHSRDLVAYLLRRQGRISQPNIGRHNDHLRSRWSECRGQAQRPNRRIGLLRRHPRLLAVPLTLLTRTLLIETNPRLGWALPLIAGKAEPTEQPKPEQPQKEAAGTPS